MIRVVLCTHNGIQFLEEQLASIMTQRRPVDVVHLFDFGSSDGTLELARRLAARWPKLDVREVAQAPGVVLSFFHAFAVVESECDDHDVIFLSDQDDFWLPGKTETILASLEAERADETDLVLLFHDVRICDESLRTVRPSFYEGRPFRMPRDLDRSRLLIANPVIGHTMAFTKGLMSLAVASLRPKHYLMHDWALALLAAHVGRLIYVDEPLSLYRQHAANILGAGRKRSFVEYILRANRLSGAVLEQVATFEQDLGKAVDCGARAKPILLSGAGPLRWRLARTYFMKGPTLGHRLAAVLPLIQRSRPPVANARRQVFSSRRRKKAGHDLGGRKQDVIAIVGTRGVPARYGGFETLAEQLARHLNAEEVPLALYGQKSAYSASDRRGNFAGHRRRWMPLSASGAQSLIHDALQLGHAAFVERYRNVLLLGTSAAWLVPLVRLLRRRMRLVCNVDGLEWRRDKFGPVARIVLKASETIAVRSADSVIADNDALVTMVRHLYQVEPTMIPYGGDHIEILGQGFDPAGFALAIARIEPENNSAMILEAARMAGAPIHFVGNWSASAYGRKLLAAYGDTPECTLHSAIYEQNALAQIRSASSVYVHGHSVGGTNPSLVEALFHSQRILAFDCSFNRATLENEGMYFQTVGDLARLLGDPLSGLISQSSLQRLREKYRWSTISRQYAEFFANDLTMTQPDKSEEWSSTHRFR